MEQASLRQFSRPFTKCLRNYLFKDLNYLNPVEAISSVPMDSAQAELTVYQIPLSVGGALMLKYWNTYKKCCIMTKTIYT